MRLARLALARNRRSRCLLTFLVRVRVDADMPCQLIGAAEFLFAARMSTGVRLFTRVCTDMSSLVLQAVESPGAKRALVWPWNLRLVHTTRGLALFWRCAWFKFGVKSSHPSMLTGGKECCEPSVSGAGTIPQCLALVREEEKEEEEGRSWSAQLLL